MWLIIHTRNMYCVFSRLIDVEQYVLKPKCINIDACRLIGIYKSHTLFGFYFIFYVKWKITTFCTCYEWWQQQLEIMKSAMEVIRYNNVCLWSYLYWGTFPTNGCEADNIREIDRHRVKRLWLHLCTCL